MADHLRKQIRENVGSTVGALTTTGSRVFQSRMYPVQESELPCLLIYTLSESVAYKSAGRPRQTLRGVQVMVEALHELVTDLDDKLDLICKEVEVALCANVKRGGVAIDTRLVSTEVTMVGGDGAKPIGSARMTWLVEYSCREGAPDVLADT